MNANPISFNPLKMELYTIYLHKQAQKDLKLIMAAGLKAKVEVLLKKMQEDPYCNPPPYEKLVGDLKGAYSRRITIQHRLVYQVYKEEKAIKVIRMWPHYE